jgi:hypothetical protein
MYRGIFAAFILGLCTLAGCGGSDTTGRQPVYKVSGTVTLNGAPLDGAIIAFAPQDGQPTAVGKTDAEGKYQLTSYDFGDGAAAGAFRVVINKTVAAPAGGGAKVLGGDDHEAAEAAASTHSADSEIASVNSAIPSQYTSSVDTPLIAIVENDKENNFPFEL